MDIKKLSPNFYSENRHLTQALDLEDGKWTSNKERGHGVVQIKFKDLIFAIPLRSNIPHKSACFTVSNKGLDFAKALLIEKKEQISNENFMIAQAEFLILQKKEITIAKRFEKYINRYVKAKKNRDMNILNRMEYRYSTLPNYDDILLVD